MKQKKWHLNIAQYMLDNTNSNFNFLNPVITGDGTWIYGYDVEIKMQSQWQHLSFLRPEKAQQVHSKIKVMLTIFFDSCHVVHHEYTTTRPNHQKRVLPRGPSSPSWCYALQMTRSMGSENLITIMIMYLPILFIWFRLLLPNITFLWFIRLPTYLTRLQATFTTLFASLKIMLKGIRFESRGIMRNATTHLLPIPKTAF